MKLKIVCLSLFGSFLIASEAQHPATIPYPFPNKTVVAQVLARLVQPPFDDAQLQDKIVNDLADKKYSLNQVSAILHKHFAGPTEIYFEALGNVAEKMMHDVCMGFVAPLPVLEVVPVTGENRTHAPTVSESNDTVMVTYHK